MPFVEIKDIYNKDPFLAPKDLAGAGAAVAANYGAFLPIHFPCEVMEFSAAWETASLSGTLQLEKLTGTQAPGSGVNLLSTAIDTSGTANTLNFGTLVIGSSRQLKRGDRLAISDGGTLTSMVGLSTATLIKPLGKGHYQSNAKSLI